MKQTVTVKQPDRLSSYFKTEWNVLLAVTITGIIYNIGLLAGLGLRANWRNAYLTYSVKLRAFPIC